MESARIHASPPTFEEMKEAERAELERDGPRDATLTPDKAFSPPFEVMRED